MCLQIKLGQQPRVAEEDIVIYKYLEFYRGTERLDERKGLLTPFMWEPTELNVEYTSPDMIERAEGHSTLSVGRHAYTDLETARNNAFGYCPSNVEYWIAKGIIPKGANYFINESCGSIVADKIIYQEVIETGNGRSFN